MHTLLIHQAFSWPGQPGGTRHFELASHALASGDQFSVVTSKLHYTTGKPTTEEPGLVVEDVVGGVHLLRAYTYPSLHQSFIWRVFAFLSFMVTSVLAALRVRDVDVIMGTTPPIFQAVSALILARVRRRPFLLEVRDLWPEFAIDIGVLRNPILIRMSRWLESFLYANADHILVNSPAYITYLQSKAVPPRKITLIANGVSLQMFDPEATGDEVRKRWNLEGCFVATYAGALGLANDIPTILHAAERLQSQPHIKFLLVGDGKERANLEEYVRSRNITNVVFTGIQPKDQMSAYLAASDVCIATLQNIPMFTTTYPNKVFDYMAAGRPTVLAIDGVIRKVIEDAQGGIFVPPGNDLALAQTIVALASNPDVVASMGRSARAYVESHFDRAQQGRQFVALLRTLARGKA